MKHYTSEMMNNEPVNSRAYIKDAPPSALDETIMHLDQMGLLAAERRSAALDRKEAADDEYEKATYEFNVISRLVEFCKDTTSSDSKVRG